MYADNGIGSFEFSEAAPGWVLFKINMIGDWTSLYREYLVELGLLNKLTRKKWQLAYEWAPDFKEFLDEHGYTNAAQVLRDMRTSGLLLKADRAIAFRLRFL